LQVSDVTKTFGRRGMALDAASPALRANAAPNGALDRGPGGLPLDKAIGEKSLIAKFRF
jgi:hypothetical protein